LFDVMGEAVKRAVATAAQAPDRSGADAHRPAIRVVGGAEPSRPHSGYPRLPSTQPDEEQRHAPEWAHDDAPHGWRLFGLPAQYVLIAFSALLLVVSLTAMVAFRLGKAQEASDILGQDHSAPPPSLTGMEQQAPVTDRTPVIER
jgi:hypothetical protein